jgi:hypothetical protein
MCKVLNPDCDETYRLAQYAEVRTNFREMRAPPHRSTAVPFARIATWNRKTSRIVKQCENYSVFLEFSEYIKKRGTGVQELLNNFRC